MVRHRHIAIVCALASVLALAACGGRGILGQNTAPADPSGQTVTERAALGLRPGEESGSTIWDLFSSNADPNVTLSVNKYIWNASLDVLSFLPVESVDPFTGVIVTGYGRPPGGGRAYRATIYVQDVALEARSLKLAMQAQGGGAVAPETIRAVEDAILTRARELRVQDAGL